MEQTEQLKLLLTTFAANLPVLLICCVAGIVILAKWRQGSSGSLWALLGFGFALVLCFVLPLAQTALRQWVLESGQMTSRMWAFTAFGAAASMLHAIVYALLLVAIFAGRPKADSHI